MASGGTATVPTTPAYDDAAALRYVCVVLLGDDRVRYDEGHTELARAFKANGIKGFRDDLVGLTSNDIMSMEVPAFPGVAADNSTTPPKIEVEGHEHKKLSLAAGRKLCCAVSYFHYLCTLVDGNPVDMAGAPKDNFDKYRVYQYNPAEPIIPFSVAMVKKTDKEVDHWNKQIKLSSKEFPKLREAKYWSTFNREWTIAIGAQNLGHLLDEAHVPVNKELYSVQQKWMYKALTDSILAPTAKAIVKAHIVDQDTGKIWSEIVEAMTQSMAQETYVAQLSTHITSTRINDGKWRGSQANYILNLKEQMIKYNELSPEPYTDRQMVTFMSNAVNGAPNLSSILTLDRRARKVAKNNAYITFEEYVADLIVAAETHDIANGTKRGTNRMVSTHEYRMDDESVGDEIFGNPDYKVNNHEMDMDTPFEEFMVHQTDVTPNKPRLVKMDIETWKKLSPEDRKQWDTISDGGKTEILKYGSKSSSWKGNQECLHKVTRE